MSTIPNDLEMPGNGTTGSQPAWKRELGDKVAAARARRQAGASGPGQSNGAAARGEVLAPNDAETRAARVAATVAARYAQAPTYSDYLASEVQAAMTAAILAQQCAAQAVAEAEHACAMVAQLTAPLPEPEIAFAAAPERPLSPPAIHRPGTPPGVRVDYEASGIPSRPAPAPSSYFMHSAAGVSNAPGEPGSESVRLPLGADLLAEALITPAIPLPAKLLEFPRELIAARKARPRHAEGPLRDDPEDQSQLRIFEVEPEAISTRIEAAPLATEWSSIRLDAYPPAAHPTEVANSTATGTVSSNYSQSTYLSSGVSPRRVLLEQKHSASYAQAGYAHDNGTLLVNPASVGDRLMAAIVDACLVGIAFLLFVFVFTASTVHPPTGRPAIIGSSLVLAGFYLLYQLLFFTFADGTPGMLYARIALCTFDDDNPTRDAMRKRIFAVVLAGMPLGLGFLYAIFDEDHLGWHDRMTRMYQRSYK